MPLSMAEYNEGVEDSIDRHVGGAGAAPWRVRVKRRRLHCFSTIARSGMTR